MFYEAPIYDEKKSETSRKINELGSQGWELVSAVQGGNSSWNTLWFKRQPTLTAPTEFRVVLTGAGVNKIGVIKVVREITGLGLKEAKDLVDGVPMPVITSNSENEAISVAKMLKEAGAIIEFQER
jgi:ribosomal protein L7/L12